VITICELCGAEVLDTDVFRCDCCGLDGLCYDCFCEHECEYDYR
jgi:hypothetical protein